MLLLMAIGIILSLLIMGEKRLALDLFIVFLLLFSVNFLVANWDKLFG